jgi:hypothetical protein
MATRGLPAENENGPERFRWSPSRGFRNYALVAHFERLHKGVLRNSFEAPYVVLRGPLNSLRHAVVDG